MSSKYFEGLKKVADVKQHYRTLCFQYHPDVGGDTAIMQDINAAYLAILKSFDGQVSRGSDGKDHTYKYQRAREVGAMGTIDKLLQLQLSDAVEIELLGYWVWISGIEYKSEDQRKVQSLKDPSRKRKDGQPASLLSWHSKRKRYYWKPEGMQSYYNARATFGDLRSSFGSYKFQNEKQKHQPQGQPALIGAN